MRDWVGGESLAETLEVRQCTVGLVSCVLVFVGAVLATGGDEASSAMAGCPAVLPSAQHISPPYSAPPYSPALLPHYSYELMPTWLGLSVEFICAPMC